MKRIALILLFLSSNALAATVSIDTRLVPAVQYATPITGDTITSNTNGYTRLLINPAGTLLALTVNFPSAPSDGDIFEICSSQAVTTLTMGNGTAIGALTTMAVGTFASYIYNATASKWFRNG